MMGRAVNDSQFAAGRQAAAKYLRELLLRQGRYRPQWERFAERVRSGRINHLAVAEVLARHLWNAPRTSGDADLLPRQLKDTVGRALSGHLLSRATLALFIEAFGFSGQEEDRLWRLWGGVGPDQRAVRAARDGPQSRGGGGGRPRPAQASDALTARSSRGRPGRPADPHAHPAGHRVDRRQT